MATTFCAQTALPATMTINDLQTPFPNSLLPTSASRTQDGLITDDSLQAWLQSLQSSGVIPVRPDMTQLQGGQAGTATGSPLAVYVQQEGALLDQMKSEFCYYEVRYKYSLNQLLNSVAQTSLPATPTAGAQSTFEMYLPVTKILNQNMNDLSQVVNGIAKLRYSLSQGDSQAINSINATLAARSVALQKQSTILSSGSTAADLRKRMVEYTEEKNKATSNLLTLYAVLNIVAIGVLVVLSRG